MQEADLPDRRLALYSAGAGEPSEAGLAALLPLATAFVPRDKQGKRVTRPTPGTPQWGPTAENCFLAVGRPTAEDSTAGDYAAVGEAQQAARAGVAGATGGARSAARLCTWVNGL